MTNIFLWIALLVALLDWIALSQKWTVVDYIAKPGVMVALLAWLWSIGGLTGPLAWFTVGVLFSMLGDIFLMLPRERFVAGLVSFLLAHIAYIVGLNAVLPPLNLATLALALIVGVTGGQVFRRIAAGLRVSGQEKLRLPVAVYSGVISLMLLSALMTLTQDTWMSGPAILVSLGALLFYLSDIFLAWNKFVSALPHGRLWVRITYHTGQILLIFGAGLHFVLLS